ncbi:hypothetical protein CAPTEDRAFT_221655 [Capitella teleta]|uniref:SUEL-type lectin domain-containing protein n=1 Tax=Capitella teleta TaxID=283909 RepID=R7V2M9_CAPTE|nr:hypothetical protein CAPTEDRAFT_221655 [Capitella teleta]|eukprot:ELU10586.1 hypothetical protein CAPTEDRAFT_221655 [Capitella teleta]
MSRSLMMLLVLGLVVAAVSAHRGGGRGGSKSGSQSGGQVGGQRKAGGRGGHGGGKGGMGGLVCNVVDATGFSMTKTCPTDAGDCTLGPLEYVDAAGAVTRTVNFCDGLDDAGSSLVAARACLIKDSTKATVLVDNTAKMTRRGVAPTCDLEVAVTYENAAAFAYFPTKDCKRTTTIEEEEQEEIDVIEG